MADVSVVSEEKAPPIVKGTRIRFLERRIVPLSPFGTFYLIDLPQELEEFSAAERGKLMERGIGVVRLVEFDRAEWIGVFTYEIEIVFSVAAFFPAQGKTVEEVQASAAAIVIAVAVTITALSFGYVAYRAFNYLEDTGTDLGPALSVVAIALGFLAIALLVREVRKVKALTHGTL